MEDVSETRGALDYFGFSYYQENRERLTVLAVDGGEGCVYPSIETVQNGTYRPLSRPLFLYVSRSELSENEVLRDFVRFMLENERTIARNALFVSLTREKIAEQLEKLEELTA